MKVLLAILAFGALAACQRNVIQAASPEGKPVVFFQKTPCFGQCPVYEAEFYENDMMVYRGQRHVDVIDTLQISLPPGTVDSLRSRAVAINFGRFDDEYPSLAPDLPGTVCAVRLPDGEYKQISAVQGVPDELREYQRYLDERIMRFVESQTGVPFQQN